MDNYKALAEFVGQQVNLSPITNSYRILIKLKELNRPLLNLHKGDDTLMQLRDTIGQLQTKYKSMISEIAKSNETTMLEELNTLNLRRFIQTF